jgi:antitoxin (DNA-binding transcriptional repressor) of toxin-antitoxin stability system
MANTISKSKLKAKMLEVFREIEASGKELIVTDHNKPVLRIVPIRKKTTVDHLFGRLQGKVVYFEDINSPTLDEWNET